MKVVITGAKAHSLCQQDVTEKSQSSTTVPKGGQNLKEAGVCLKRTKYNGRTDKLSTFATMLSEMSSHKCTVAS